MSKMGIVGSAATVSAIIPTFNRRELLKHAIDSVLAQTLPPIETIVVDDGSTDGTEQMVKAEYGDRVTYRYQPNQGESVARNSGARLASSKYLAFLDSDDCWLPEKLERQVAALESHDDGRVCAVFGSALWIDAGGSMISRHAEGRHVRAQSYDLERFIRSPMILGPSSNMLVRKDCFDEIGGFDTSIDYGEDWDLVIRLRAKWEFLYVDTPLFLCRVHRAAQQSPADLSTIRAVLADKLRIVRKSSHLIEDPRRRMKVVQEIESHHYRLAAYQCLDRTDWDSGVGLLVRAVELSCGEWSVPLALAQAIGHWGARSALERLGTPVETMRHYFHDECLPNILSRIPEHTFISRRLERESWGVFYRDLALGLAPQRSWKVIAKLFLKAVSFRPRYLLSISTLGRFASTYFRGDR